MDPKENKEEQQTQEETKPNVQESTQEEQEEETELLPPEEIAPPYSMPSLEYIPLPTSTRDSELNINTLETVGCTVDSSSQDKKVGSETESSISDDSDDVLVITSKVSIIEPSHPDPQPPSPERPLPSGSYVSNGEQDHSWSQFLVSGLFPNIAPNSGRPDDQLRLVRDNSTTENVQAEGDNARSQWEHAPRNNSNNITHIVPDEPAPMSSSDLAAAATLHTFAEWFGGLKSDVPSTSQPYTQKRKASNSPEHSNKVPKLDSTSDALDPPVAYDDQPISTVRPATPTVATTSHDVGSLPEALEVIPIPPPREDSELLRTKESEATDEEKEKEN